MLDLTKEIRIEKDWKRIYSYLRFFVFMIFILTGVFVSYRILFPSEQFEFFFATPNASRNSIIFPHKDNGELYQDGNISKNESLIFNTGVIGNFSNSKITLSLEKNLMENVAGSISARKSFQAFFYPEGSPMPFKEGSLLKNGTDYYIVSENKLRKFSSENVITQLGLDVKAFAQIDSKELTLNEMGYDISQSTQHPEGSLFHIGDEYMQLKDGKLFRFVSERAFLTRHTASQAIEKETSFSSNYEISEEFIGFSDGTLLSYDISVYIVSGKNSYPVNNPRTFESMGYLWENIIPANSEEIGMYEEQKLFTLDSPHPEGTIFKASDTGRYFYIKDKQKRELTGPEIIKSYVRSTPIAVEEKGLSSYSSCQIKPGFRLFGKYECDISLETINSLPGNNFQFKAMTKRNIEAQKLEANFHQLISVENMKGSLSVLKKRVLDNYIAQ